MTISFQTNSDGHKYFVAKDNNQIKQFREMFGYSLQDVKDRLEVQDGSIVAGDVIFIETKEVRDKIDSKKALEEENKQLKEDKTTLENEKENESKSNDKAAAAAITGVAGAVACAKWGASIGLVGGPAGAAIGGVLGAVVGWGISALFD